MIYNINKFSNVKFKFFKYEKEKDRKFYINRENPNQRKDIDYKFLSVEGDSIYFEDKELSRKEFFKDCYNKRNIYVSLTFSESFQMSEKNFITIEKLFPFVSTIEFKDLELKDKYAKLIEIKQELFDKFFISRFKSIQQQYSSYLRFKQNKKIHYKSILDNNFFFSIKPGFSDVFTLLENREDRKIFLLDVNSMYPYAMTMENYSIPSLLQYYKENNIKDILSGSITNGIFNCVLKIKNLNAKDRAFIRYLPVNLIDNNVSIPLNITKNDEVNILLHANEIKFYSKYFDIKLEDGIYSKRSINHPLKQWVLDTYDKRLNTNGLEKDFYKFILVLSHSIVMKRNLEEEYLDNNNVNFHFMDKYQYKIDSGIDMHNSYINLEDYDENIKVSNSYRIENNFNVYSLYSQVLANARIHLLETYEKFYNVSKDFELCYCNIDSLHISLPLEQEDKFNEVLDEMYSPNVLGKLKLESIANRGVWFEPGRYWLFQDKELVGFKNTIFNDNNTNPKCIFKKIEYLDLLNDYKVSYFSLFKSLQHKKKIHKSLDKKHYLFYKNKTNTNLTLLMNKKFNIKTLKKVFNDNIMTL